MASFRTAAFLSSSKKALLVVQGIQTARPYYSAWSKLRSPEPTHLGTTAIMTRPFASVSRLSPDDRTAALSKVSSWTTASGDRDAITKTFEFRDFQQAWSFMSEIATTAETMNHHPEWFNVYNRVVVTLTTHDCHGLSEKDISLAETMDACAAKLETNSDDANATTDPSTPLSFQPTCDLYDEYLDAARVPNVQFQTMGGKSQFCGTAVTVKCFEDNSRIKEIVSTTNGRGKVLVVDGGGSQRCALLGDMVAKLAVDNEWEGIIVYANVRDVEELRTLNIGIMALGSTPRKSVRRGEGQVDLPVQIGNVWCRPGDKVYADENGVLIVD